LWYCGHLLLKDGEAKSLLPFEVSRCRNCGDGMLLGKATKVAFFFLRVYDYSDWHLEKLRKQSTKFLMMKIIKPLAFECQMQIKNQL
jgi:hypothetical protein